MSPLRKIQALLIVAVVLTAMGCSSGKNEPAMFESLPASHTNINFVNQPEKHELFNILYFLYYYNGGGVATGDINNDGLPDIFFTANKKGGNKLYLNKGKFQFEDITESAGVAGISDWASGVTMADVNGDGLLDIYVSTVSNKYGLKGHNELYINQGNNKFTEESAKYGLNTSCLSTQAVFFDYDRDGDLDCYILNQSHRPHANITDTTFRHRYDSLTGDRLYRNDISTTGKFTDVSKEAGIYQSSLGYGLGIAVADVNQDGWDDIYVGNDFHENDYYYINNGNGTFTESGARHFAHYSRFSMGNDIADYNNDGQPDIVTVDMLPDDEKILKTYGSDENADIYKVKLDLNGYQKQYSRNALQRNNGRGESFSEVALISGISATDWSWAPLFADFDNDGNKDLFISSGIVKRPVDLDYVRFVSDLDMKKGRQLTDKFDDEAISKMPDGSSHPYFYKGDGKLKFTDMSKDWGTSKMRGYYTGAAYADFDNDGNMDVVINAIGSPAIVLKNNAPSRTMVNIQLKGPIANRFGVGTKIWLFAGGKMQYQQLMLTRGFQSSCEARLHFGLDSVRYIDSMLIVWPDQKFQKLTNIPAVGRLEFNYGEAAGQFDYNANFPPKAPEYLDVTNRMQVNWTHKENDFFDYNRQYLIPHQLSTRGPKLAVGDVNKDGLDDFYVCGAAGQPGQLMIQTAKGTFISIDESVFAPAAASEDVDAIFFDANNDGYPDLYVVSGGNQLLNNDPGLADHFYLNDGKGHFKASPASIPALLRNKSCVAMADVDKDGDIDLFVGGLADAKQYGIAQSSYLLLNNGQASFTPAPAGTIALDSIGMVTAASFVDLDQDGWQDLVVTGEWMPLKIFMNKNGRFIEADLPASTGLWQSVQIADINNDGKPDILAGNWGHNSKLYAGKNGPLKLYVKDFDKNGSVEQIMAYTIDGKEYPFLAKDELERPLPVLKKAYLYYGDVAGKTVDYILYDLFKDYKELKAETLSSTCFINDGKGGFRSQVLPDELQLAPLFAFTGLGNNEWLAGGNFYGVIPYEGRYDAQLATIFTYNKNNATIQNTSFIPMPFSEIRDIRWLKTSGAPVMAVARNNDRMLFYVPNTGVAELAKKK